MARFSLTKDPGATNKVTLAQKDPNATAIEVTKNPGGETIAFAKNQSTRVRIVKQGGGALFAPDDVANIRAWYKADALSLSDTDPVATWTDSAGSNDLTQGTAGFRPLYRTNQINGKPAVKFDGVDDWMRITGLTANTAMHAFIAFRNPTWTADDAIFDGPTINTMKFYQVNATPNLRLAATGATTQLAYAAVGDWHYGELLIDGASSYMSMDGGAQVTGTITMSSTGITLGAAGNGGSPCDVLIAEVVFYSTQITGADLDDLRKYFGNKYGLTTP